jgi:CheY-like chemotaxis protein
MALTHRFLIVDDVRVTRITTVKMLKDLGGAEAFHAENGQEGLNVLTEKSMYLDCVIVDFNMPVMHGLQMVKQIRLGHKNIRRDLPVIMVTGHGDRSLLGVSLELDVNGFLLKPFDKESLLKRVKLVLDTPSNEWLRSPDEYRKVDIDNPLRELLQYVRGDRKTNYSEEVTRAIKKQADARRITPFVEPPELSAKDPISENEKGCSLDTVPPGSILSRDIKGSAGNKLLAKGCVITVNTIMRLKNLVEMGEPLDQIVIIKK